MSPNVDTNTAGGTTTGTTNETQEQQYQRLYGTGTGTGTGTPAPQPQIATLPPEVLATLTAMAEKLDTLEQRQTVTPVNTTPPAKGLWVEAIRRGDWDGAEAEMEARVRRGMAADLENVRKRAYDDAMSAAHVNTEIERYLTKVRGENPDVAHFERYLEAPVAAKVEAARSAGKIRSTADFLNHYRAAVDSEVSAMRESVLRIRAQGKDEVLTRTKEVISSPTLNPQQLQIQQTQDGTQQVGESVEDYFTARRVAEARRRGLSV